ncbi:MAG: polysaccharide biosynthesis protein [Oscillospiraceae bacterium]|nr:polysaccharide biosynthesis protein [Oscillospiraceae bacterium]
MHEQKKPNFLKGAAILAATGIFVRIVGAIYKIPLFNVLDDEGVGYFQITYTIYAMVLAISTAGVPVALSRLVSTAASKGDTALVKRYFSVAMPAFFIIGFTVMTVMLIFANDIAFLMGSSLAAPGIRVLAPAVFFVCIIAVFRGYAQGFENMVPTAVSQMIEVVSKAAIGIGVAFFLARMGYQAEYISAGSITGVTVGLGLSIPVMLWFKRKIDKKAQGTRGDGSAQGDGSALALPSRMRVFLRFMKVSIPISLTASLMSVMVLIDTRVVLGRLQSALMLTESQAAEQIGILSKGLTIYNLPSTLIVPLSISIIPAIATAIAQKNKSEAGRVTKSSVKLTNLFAMPASAGIMVLAGPILKALFDDPSQSVQTVTTMTTILVILGAASYFVSLQLLSVAVLQANGYERISLYTFPIGAVVKISLSYILVANPNLGIIGSSIGTLACFIIIVSLNFTIITVKVKERFSLINGFLKPLLCTLIMAAVAFSVYKGLFMLCSGFLGTGRMAVIIYLGVAILTGVLSYLVLIVLTRTIKKEDLAYVPKGEKLSEFLGLR